MKTHKFLFPFKHPEDTLTTELVKSYKACKIIYFIPEEDSKILENSELVLEFEDILKKNNSCLEIWLGNFEDNIDRLKKIDADIKHISVVNWSTHLLNLSYFNFRNDYVPNYSKNINFLFSCFNRRPAYHKCLLIDKIYQKQMNNHGKISWLNHKNNKGSFNFQYFDNRSLIVDSDCVISSYENPRTKMYENCLFDIISESEVGVKDISEKTWFSYLYEKPNIVLGYTEIHKKLESLGFSMYNEFFDYNFDSNPDLESRIELILDNVFKYKSQDYIELYNCVLPKIKQNKDVAISLIYDKSLVPRKLTRYRKRYSNRYPLLDYYAKVGKII